MKNPGLFVFADTATLTRPPGHFPDLGLEDESFEPEYSEYTPPAGFGRWRTPGSTVRVPYHFKDSDDAGYGEVLDPVERDGADRIINGDHESSTPSENPFVEKARQELHTPESDISVHTLASLLSGSRASVMPAEDMEAAHEWLKRRFSGVRVNPHHGVLQAASPAGVQVMRRHSTDLVVPGRGEQPKQPRFSLANKHGTFESHDPKRLVRAMAAFQIMHNEVAAQRKKDDDNQDDGINTTAGFIDRIKDGAKRHLLENPANLLHDMIAPKKKPDLRLPYQPKDAVFEAGAGTDVNEHGVRGGYVAHGHQAPLFWHRDASGVAYSPGHEMNEVLDPKKSKQVRNDPYFKGHTFTYAPSAETGHTIQRHDGNLSYYVTALHPAARHGLDAPPRSSRSKGAPAAARGRARPATSPTPPAAPPPGGSGFDFGLVSMPKPPPPSTPAQSDEEKPPRFAPEPYPHPRAHERPETRDLPNEALFRIVPPKTSSNLNDLCPACECGYLEPFDGTHHECLNCGSLIKQASPKPGDRLLGPRGPLGRGLSDINVGDSDPLGLASADSENVVDLDETEQAARHPLADEEPDMDYVPYQAPRRILGSNSEFWDRYSDEDHEGHEDHVPDCWLCQGEDHAWHAPEPSTNCWMCDANKLNGWSEVEHPKALPEQTRRAPVPPDENLYRDWKALRQPEMVADQYAVSGSKPFELDPREVKRDLFQRMNSYEALNKQAGPDEDPAELDKALGKMGYQPLHKPGDLQRAYVADIPGAEGVYARLTEGAGRNKSWLLTADSNILPPERPEYTGPSGGAAKSVPMGRYSPYLSEQPEQFRQKMYDMRNRSFGDQSHLADGHHPIDDDHLNRTLRDVATNGRRSEAFRKLIMGSPDLPAGGSLPYIPKQLPPEDGTQRQKHILSSVKNPGLARFGQVADK